MRAFIESHKKALVILILVLGLLIVARSVFQVPTFEHRFEYTGKVLK